MHERHGVSPLVMSPGGPPRACLVQCTCRRASRPVRPDVNLPATARREGEPNLSFAKTLSARLIDLRSVWGLETLETGTRPGVRVARRRPGGDKILGPPRTIRKNDASSRREPVARGLVLIFTLPAGCSGDADHRLRESRGPRRAMAARYSVHREHLSRARGECGSGDSTRSTR